MRVDSFGPAPTQDMFGHPTQAKPLNPAGDSLKQAEQKEGSGSEEKNKVALLLLRSCKFFFLCTFAPPYFLFVKFPMGIKRFALPLIKKGNAALLNTLQQNFDKIKEAMAKLTSKIVKPIVQGAEKLSDWMNHLKTALSEAARKQFDDAKEKLNNTFGPPLNAAIMLGNGIASLAAWTGTMVHSLMKKAKSIPHGLMQIPKTVSDFANNLKNGYAHSQEALSYLMNKMKENVERAKKVIESALEKAQKLFIKAKNWPMDRAKKMRKVVENAAEYVSKVVAPMITASREMIANQVQVVINFIQQPYIAAVSIASSAKGQMERVGQALLRAFNEKASLVKISIVRTAQALIAPFKRGYRYAKQAAKKLVEKAIKQPARYLAEMISQQIQNGKNRLLAYLKTLLGYSLRLLALFKYMLKAILHGLQLFWTWVKLMSSFAAFLVRQAFREVLAWLQ